MNKNNVIDLDEILGEPRVVRYQGTDYPVKDPSLAEVLKIQRLTEAKDDKEIYNGMSDAVRMLVPGLSEKVDELPFRALSALFNGITSSLLDKDGEDPGKN